MFDFNTICFYKKSSVYYIFCVNYVKLYTKYELCQIIFSFIRNKVLYYKYICSVVVFNTPNCDLYFSELGLFSINILIGSSSVVKEPTWSFFIFKVESTKLETNFAQSFHLQQLLINSEYFVWHLCLTFAFPMK